MRPEPQDQLSPDLERQLKRLETLGNAELAFHYEPRKPGVPWPENPFLLTERQHQLEMLKLRYAREARRSRNMSLWLLSFVPLLIVVGQLATAYNYTVAGKLAILVGGLMLGLSLPVLYFSNKRMQEAGNDARS